MSQRLLFALTCLSLLAVASPAWADGYPLVPVSITNLRDQTVLVDIDADGDLEVDTDSWGVQEPHVVLPDGSLRLTRALAPGQTFSTTFSSDNPGTWHLRARAYLPASEGHPEETLASHHWLVKGNYWDVHKCRVVDRVDPQQQMPFDHFIGTSDGSWSGYLTGALLSAVPLYGTATAVIDGDFDGVMLALGFEGGAAAAFFEVAFLINSLPFLGGPESCSSVFYVRPPMPEHLRNIPTMPMVGGFGADVYTWTGDFSGDGIPDVLTGVGGHTLRMSESFGPFDWETQDYPLSSSAWGAAGYTWSGDFDGDGVDEVVTAIGGGQMVVRRGDDGFQSHVVTVPHLWGGADWTRIGDFNGDGRDDIASPYYSQVFVKLGEADGGFNAATWTIQEGWGGEDYTIVGDFDGDGRDDIASAVTGGVILHRSTGSGFASVRRTVAGMVWGGAGYTVVGDFNGDGSDDIASATYGTVHVLLGDTTNPLSQRVVWETPNEWGDAAWLRVGDFNGDGLDDIASPYHATVFMRLSTGTSFETEHWTVRDGWGSGGYTWVGDFDRDGRDDLATAYDQNIEIWHSRGVSFGHEVNPNFNLGSLARVRRAGTIPYHVAEYAIDGRAEGPAMRTGVVADPWFELDLGGELDLADVAVVPEGTLPAGVRVEASDTPCDAPSVVTSRTLTPASPRAYFWRSARYVCVRGAPNTALDLVEVLVNPRPLEHNVFLLDARAMEQSCGDGVTHWTDFRGSREGIVSGAFSAAECGSTSGWEQGPPALSFGNGADALRIDYPCEAALNPATFTVETWVRVDGGAGTWRSPVTSRWVEGGYPNRRAGYTIYASSSDTWQFWVGNGSGFSVVHGPAVAIGEWAHVVGTYDGATMTIYVNGQRYGSAGTAFMRNPTTPLRIGASTDSQQLGEYFFDGAIARVAIHDGALDDASILARYESEQSEMQRQSVFTLDASSAGQTCADGVTQWTDLREGREGIVSGGFSAADCDITSGWEEGPRALSFGTGADALRIDYPVEAALNQETFTVETWVRVDGGAGTWRSPVYFRDSGAGVSHGFNIYASSSDTWKFYLGTGTGWSIAYGPPVVMGEWTHVVGTYDGTTLRFYVNGQLVGSRVTAYAPNTWAPIRVGGGGTGAGGSQWFDGAISQVSIYDYPLDAARILARYQGAAERVFALDADLAGQTCSDGVTHWTDLQEGREGIVSGGFSAAECTNTSGWEEGPRALGFGTGAGPLKIDYPYEAALNPETFTVETWARVDGSPGTWRSPLTSRDVPASGGGRGFLIYASTSNTWQFWLGNGTGWSVAYGPPVVLGEWAHVVGTYDGTTLRFYVNGQLVGSRITAYVPNARQPLRVGAGATEGSGNFFFDGAISQVAIYEGALDAASIHTRYEVGSERFP